MHEAIAEALLCGNTEVTLDKLQDYVEDLYSVIPGDESETTNLELQFKVCVCVCGQVLHFLDCLLCMQRLALDRNDPHRWTTANKDANKTKNRFVNVLPCECSLSVRIEVDSSWPCRRQQSRVSGVQSWSRWFRLHQCQSR